MMPQRWRWLWWLLGILGVALALKVVLRFPWGDTFAALEHIDGWLLLAALMVNLLSPVAKGWAWHLLLKPVAPNRWWVAEEANVIGIAVNIIGVGVSGEVARVHVMKQRDHVPYRSGALSVVWVRVVEALGLTLFVVVAPAMLDLPRGVRGLQIGGAVGLATILIATRYRGWLALVRRLPQPVHRAAVELVEMGWRGRLLGPTALALVNWAAQWATFHLTLRATHVPASYAASFTALLAVNLGGIVRFTPANVGVMQAAMVGALLPFGVAAEQAVAAGLALQALQVLPMLGFGLALAGRSGLKRLMADAQLAKAA